MRPYLLLTLLIPSLAAIAGPLQVQIDASTVVQTMPNELFGQNWNTYEKSGDGKDAVYNATVRAMGTTQMRFPGGGYADLRIWDNIDCSGKDTWLLNIMDGIRFAQATGTQLQPIVNFSGFWCDKEHGHAEALKKAVAWVTYMNVKPRAHYAKYWEIGNEIWGSGEKGHTDGKDYGTRFVDFYKAMKKADPSIKIGAVAWEYKEKEKGVWNLAAFKAIKAGGVQPDFLAIHNYPVWLPVPGRKASEAPKWDKNWYANNPSMDARIIKNISAPETITKDVNDMVREGFGPAAVGKIDYWMTEYRSVLEYKFIEFVDTLFCAQYLLELGRLGWKGANIWALKNGYSEKTQADFGLLRTGRVSKAADDQPGSSPRPTWYIFPYLSKVFGRQMLASHGGEGDLRYWSSKDSSGNLTLFLANNNPGPAASLTAEISLKGFAAAKTGELWLIESDGTTPSGAREPIQQRRDIRINGITRPAPASLPGTPTIIPAGSKFQLALPASSMVLIRVAPAK